MDIRDELDASFGQGPPLRPAVDLLAPGRAALRRRRLGTGVAALTVALLLGGTAYAALGEHPRPRTDNGVVATERPAETPTTTAAGKDPTGEMVDGIYVPGPAEEPVEDGELVRLLRRDDRLVVVEPGAVIVERIPNPFGRRPPSYSVGAAVEFQGETTWFLLEDDGSGASKPAGGAYSTLAQWVADQVEINS